MKNYAPGKGPDYGEDKLHPKDIEIKGGAAEKAVNFWFYHKWKIIIALLLAFVLIVTCFQTCEAINDDISLLYAGPCHIGASGIEAMRAAFATALPRDFNSDGEMLVDIVGLNIFSPDQVKELNDAAKNDSMAVGVNTHINEREIGSFDNLILTGEYSLCLLDPWLYERVASAGGFTPLSETLGAVPEDAYSSYAVLFKETAFAKANAEAFEFLPDDTLLCLRNSNSMGSVLKNDTYQRLREEASEMFCAIVNYQ